MDLVEYLVNVKKIPSWDREPTINDKDLDTLILQANGISNVVHGRWDVVDGLLYGRDICKCSVCKKQQVMEMSHHMDYCPSCGARMDIKVADK